MHAQDKGLLAEVEHTTSTYVDPVMALKALNHRATMAGSY